MIPLTFSSGDLYYIGIGIFFHILVGMLWYSPLLFEKTFLKYNKLNPKAMHPMASVMVVTIFLSSMEVTAVINGLRVLAVRSIYEAVYVAYMMWQFIVFPTMAVHYLFDQRSPYMLAVYSSHHLVTMTLVAAAVSYFML